MLYIILGTTKSGKSTFAATLQKTQSMSQAWIYEAGAWARKGFAASSNDEKNAHEMDPTFKNALTQYAQQELQKNPNVSIDAFHQWMIEHNINILNDTIIVVGVRNPEDFMHLTRLVPAKVLALEPRMEHQGAVAKFEQGISAIREYAKWRMSNPNDSLTWIDVPANMTFANTEELTTFMENYE